MTSRTNGEGGGGQVARDGEWTRDGKGTDRRREKRFQIKLGGGSGNVLCMWGCGNGSEKKEVDRDESRE